MSQPSRAGSPGTASTTTAPAPSPNRKALVRSDQFVIRVNVSEPIRRTRLRPGGNKPGRGDEAIGKPGARRVYVHPTTLNAKGVGQRRRSGGHHLVRAWSCTGLAGRCLSR